MYEIVIPANFTTSLAHDVTSRCTRFHFTLISLYAASISHSITTGFVRVLENPERPGVLSWPWHFLGLEIPGKRLQVLESPGNLRNSRNTEKDVFRLVTSVGQSENFWVPVRNRIGGLRNVFFVPRSWQDEKHLSLFLYRTQNFPSLIFYFQAMQLSEFVRNVCRP